MGKPDQQPIPLPLKERLLGIQHNPSFQVLRYMLSTRRPVPLNELVIANQYPPQTDAGIYPSSDEAKDSQTDRAKIKRWSDYLITEGFVTNFDAHGFEGLTLPSQVRKQLVVLKDTNQIKNTIPTPPEEIIGANILLKITGPSRMKFPDLGINSEEDIYQLISTARIYGMRLDFQRRHRRPNTQTLKFDFVNRRLIVLQTLLEMQARIGSRSTFAEKLQAEIGELHKELISIRIERGEEIKNQPDITRASLGLDIKNLPSGYFSDKK